MATGFYVNLDHVGYFQQQVARQLEYARRASDVIPLWKIRDDFVASGGFAGVSAWYHIVPHIREWIDRADHDNESVIQALSMSWKGLRFSQEYYGKVDNEAAAKFDRTYDTSDLGSLLAPGSGKTKFSFPGQAPIRGQDIHGWSSTDKPQDYTQRDYHWVDLYPIKKLGPDTEPSAVFGQNWIAKVDQKAKSIDSSIPALDPVKWVLQTICGKDVVSWISELITGDWLAVELVARAFHWHGQVQHDLHDNLMRGLYAMQGMWTGGAGGQMQDSMQNLARNGIEKHAQFLWEARDRILKFAQVVHQMFSEVEELINWLISELEPAWFAKKAEQISDAVWQGFVGALRRDWDKLVSKIGEIQGASERAGALIAAASALSGISSRGGIPIGFRHPADTNHDGHASAGERTH
jgi:hypothetical protein